MNFPTKEELNKNVKEVIGKIKEAMEECESLLKYIEDPQIDFSNKKVQRIVTKKLDTLEKIFAELC